MNYKDWLAFVGVRVQHCIAFSLERLFYQKRGIRFLLVKPCIYIYIDIYIYISLVDPCAEVGVECWISFRLVQSRITISPVGWSAL